MKCFALGQARLAVLAGFVATGLIAGCSTTEDPGTGAINTGTYPNLNIKPGIAAEQFSPEERATEGEALKQAQSAAVGSGGAVPTNKQAQLSNVARTHAKKTLDQIEKKDCSPRPTCD